jgi:hypothetical protein
LRDAEGAPVSGASVRVFVSPRAGLPFTEFPLPRWWSDRDGHVRLPISHAPEARWRLVPDGDLVVVGPEWITGDGFTVIVERRARNLPVGPAPAVSGRVLLDEWDDGDPPLAEKLTAELFAGGDVVTYGSVTADGRFHLNTRGEQRYDVVIRPSWRVGATAIVRDVPVDESFEIDLRGEFTLVRLSGIDARGARVPIQVRAVGERMGRGASSFAPEVVVALDRRNTDVVVSSPGYRDVILRGLARDEVVRFVEHAIPVEIVCADLPALPANVSLDIVVAREETLDPLDTWACSAVNAQWTAPGVASVLASAPGPHRVGLVARPAWSFADTRFLARDDWPRIEVNDGPGAYVVRFDRERVEALIEAARR